MARDKLITIRIEGDKREAFNNLAKSQNTDTASLLYDFISGCLDGTLDISLVTGKGNRLDKLDNQIDTNRLDKIDNQLDTIAKKLADYVEAFDSRLNALSSQLDSQRLDRIDTDSPKDRQGETRDIEPVATVEIADNVETVIETVETVDNVESADTIEPDNGAIGPVHGDSPQLNNQLSEAVTIKNRQGLTNAQLHKKTCVPVSTIEKWKGKMKVGEPIVSKRYPNFFKQWRLNPSDNLWYKID